MSKKPQQIVKVEIPTLERTRLFSLLDSARSIPLIWINAPAGSGKSTLINSYLKTRKLRSLWYTCTDEDNNLASFFHFLGLRHKQQYPQQQGKLPRLQTKQQSTVSTFGNVFFHKLFSNLSSPSVLVFDDFHRIEKNSKLYSILRNVLFFLPTGLSIIVISRSRPPSTYARLRVANKISEISVKEMMFTRQESDELVRLMLPDTLLEKELLVAWYNKTQGWVTGLILLLKQLQHNLPFHCVDNEVVHEYIFDYFAGEYFDDLNRTSKEFLVVTNLLTSFGSWQAKELTENAKARQILHDMVNCQFITFQRKNFQIVYQFHPLFHEFLLTHLGEMYSDSDILLFKNKAAKLLVSSGQLDDAVTLYQQTGNHQAISQLIVKYVDKAYRQGSLKHLQSWVFCLPKRVVAQEPWLAYWLGMEKLQCDPIAAKLYFEIAINLFIQTDDAKGAYLSWAGVANSIVLAFHSFKGARQWMDTLNTIRQHWLDFPDMETQIQVTFSALNFLVHTSVDYTEIKEWTIYSENLYRFIPEQTQNISIKFGLIQRNNIVGNIGKTRKLVIENYNDLMSENTDPLKQIIACAGITNSACIMQLPDNIDAMTVLNKGLKIAKQSNVHTMDSTLLAQGIQLLLQRNDIKKAKQYLFKLQQVTQTGCFISRAYYYLMASHIEAEQRNHFTALAYLTDSIEIIKEHAAESIHELFFRAVLAL